MFGPIGSDIMSIFRLLSPAEIDKYIEAKKVQKISGSMAASGESLSFDEHGSHTGEDQLRSKLSEQAESAEVIPINKNIKLPSEDQSSEAGQETEHEGKPEFQNEFTQHKLISPEVNSTETSRPKSDLEKMGVLSASTLRLQELNRLEEELQGRDSTTAFLIKEREKMRKSKMRLVEQHAYKVYKKNANQELIDSSQELEEDEEEVSNSTKGILINKKHY
jgi:hypothetical protein